MQSPVIAPSMPAAHTNLQVTIHGPSQGHTQSGTRKQSQPTGADSSSNTGSPGSTPDSTLRKPSSFLPPPQLPTQQALQHVYYDFNYGARIYVSPQAQKQYVVTLIDPVMGCVLYHGKLTSGKCLHTHKTYYQSYKILLYQQGNMDTPIFQHTMDLSSHPVLIQFPEGAIGDTIGWFSYIQRFRDKFNVRDLTVSMLPAVADIFKDQYPDIKFTSKQHLNLKELQPYATYNMGLFFHNNVGQQPFDFRYVGLHRTAGYILGLTQMDDLSDIPPRVRLDSRKKIRGKYVVIATKGSSQAKYWNNPQGWFHVIKYLKSLGYRVLCIDKQRVHGPGTPKNSIPNGCQDFTGALPLQQRIDLISHAQCFIGLSSGLSWLAWCCKVPVVLISGFTDPFNQFYTRYRVHNPYVCHGCWHGLTDQFDHGDFMWCPRKDRQPQKFECTKAITPQLVISYLSQVPGIRRSIDKLHSISNHKEAQDDRSR